MLHTRLSSVVFPAFALPITRMRKWLYFARSFAASNSFLCDPGLNTFFSRLRNPLDSLAVCWGSSAILMRVGDNKCSHDTSTVPCMYNCRTFLCRQLMVPCGRPRLPTTKSSVGRFGGEKALCEFHNSLFKSRART